MRQRQMRPGATAAVAATISRQARRQILPLLFAAAALWLLGQKLGSFDGREILAQLGAIAPRQWMVAIMATMASFWAVGRYDAVVHGLMGTGVAPAVARSSGAAAIAIGQFAGFGPITGALVRWRLLPDTGLVAAFRISLAVSMGFVLGWSVLAAAAWLLLAPVHGLTIWPALLVLGAVPLAALISLLQPRGLPALPSLRAMASLMALVSIDIGFAAVAMAALMPEAGLGEFLPFLAAFALSLGAGLIAGTPGGVGPFELMLLTLLPHVPAEALLAAALGFRFVYHLLPAGLAFLLLLRGLPAAGRSGPQTGLHPARHNQFPPEIERDIWACPWAEANLARQGRFAVIEVAGRASGLAAPLGQSLVILGDPVVLRTDAGALLAGGGALARRRALAPVLYKCGPGMALAARKRGWTVLAIADQALVTPARYDPAQPRCRGLRRQLRKAELAGVRVQEAGRVLPLDAMAEVAADWSRAHGGERSFSMGRFAPAYVSTQRVFLAYVQDRLVGFVSLHETAGEWALDLMRHAAGAPDGTMHLTVHQAILAARQAQIGRLSLAAAPLETPRGGGLVGAMQRRLSDRSGGAGLRRFKDSFAPDWRPLYAAAPGPLRLSLGLGEILREIMRPERAAPAGAGQGRVAWRPRTGLAERGSSSL